jgi:hypothetical protein
VTGVFINYRRGAHVVDAVEGIEQRLVEYFGRDQVFRDVSSIPLGDRFPAVLRDRLVDSEVVLAVMHEGWLAERDEHNVRLLDRPDCWVRKELELAIETGRTIIPVLLDDARMPAASELPDTIRDVAHRQAHRLRTAPGDCAADLDRLVRALELVVAPTWLPRDAATIPARQPRRWWLPATLAVAGLLVAGPPLLTWDDSPAPPGRVPVTFQLAGWSVFLMGVPLVVNAVRWSLRRWVNSIEHGLHRASERVYWALVGAPATLVLLVLPLVWALRVRSEPAFVVSMAAATVGLMYSGGKFLQEERADAELQTNWPYRLPSPLPVRTLRRSVAIFEEKLSGWPVTLSRENRDKANWMLNELDDGATAMAADATRSGLSWPVHVKPLWLICYTFWAAVTVGLTGAAVAPNRGHGWAYLLVPVALMLSLALALSVGAMAFNYRRQRWLRREVAAEVRSEITKIRGTVSDASNRTVARP